MYYLDARYYDSVTARFISEDTYTGEKNDPLTLNLYMYCSNNSITYDDPSGHKKETKVVATAVPMPMPMPIELPSLPMPYAPDVSLKDLGKDLGKLFLSVFGLKYSNSPITNGTKDNPNPAPANTSKKSTTTVVSKNTTVTTTASTKTTTSTKNNPAPGNPPAQAQSTAGSASPSGGNNNKKDDKNNKPTSKTFGKPIETQIGGKSIKLRVDAEPAGNKIQIQAGKGKDSIVDIRIDPSKPLGPQIPKNLNLTSGQIKTLLSYLQKAVNFLNSN